MLIILLLVGLVFSSPIPETDGQSSPSNDGEILDAASEAKSPPILQTVPFTSYGEPEENIRDESRSRLQTNPLDDIDDLVPVSITSPSMFSNGGKTLSSETHLSSEDRRTPPGGGRDITKDTSERQGISQKHDPSPKINSEVEFKPQDFHVTSEVRTVQFQIVKKSRHDSFVPPIVFAQQPPEINLEPTEVEAPGTTPTTVAMVTDNMPLTTHPAFPISLLAANQTFQIYKVYNSKKNKGDFTNIHVQKASMDDLPQRDDPGRLTLESYPTGGQSSNVNVFMNETSKIIRDSPLVYIKNFSNSAADKEEKDFEDIIRDDIIKDSLSIQRQGVGQPFKKAGDAMSSEIIMDELTSRRLMTEALRNENVRLDNKTNLKAAEPSLVLAEEITAEGPLCNKTRYTNATVKCLTMNHSSAFIASRLLKTNQSMNMSDFMKAPVNVTGIGVSETVAKDSLGLDTTAIHEKNGKESSNIEIREANDEAYFRSLSSGENRESRIFFESGKNGEEADHETTQAPIESTTQPNNGQFKMEVYTASSEINYRNFNPEVNSSVLVEPEMPLASTHYLNGSQKDQSSSNSDLVGQDHLEESKPLEEPHISKVKVTYGGRVSDSLDKSEERSKQEHDHSTEISSVDASPSREATVKSIKVNVSSPTLPGGLYSPSGRIIKAPRNEDFRLLPEVLESDSEEAFPLGIYPQKPSLSPPMQQERISIPISEAINKSMTPAGVAGIVMGVLLSVFIVAGAVGFYYYHRQTDIRPKVLSSDRSCANSDSGGYLDDQCRVAYVNSQVDISKGTPEDLVSLDNDSFLNSLESMTIQNLWTDSIRHTKL